MDGWMDGFSGVIWCGVGYRGRERDRGEERVGGRMQ